MNNFYFLIIFLVFYPPKSNADLNKLVRCLALEEEKFHEKKESGPNYKLNQTVLNLMIQTPIDHIKKSIIDEICTDKKSPTKILLKKAMFQQMNLFHFNRLKDPIKEQQVLAISESFIEQTYSIFFAHLWSLQKYVTDPKCLEKTIPSYKSLMEVYKHLEDTESKRKLFDQRDIRNAFRKIENNEEILKNCNS